MRSLNGRIPGVVSHFSLENATLRLDPMRFRELRGLWFDQAEEKFKTNFYIVKKGKDIDISNERRGHSTMTVSAVRPSTG